jgi:hypothetical protein
MAENNRCVSNGDQVSRVAALAMKRGKSVDFTGYWQRCGMSYPTLRRCFFATMGRWITDCARKTQRPIFPSTNTAAMPECSSAARRRGGRSGRRSCRPRPRYLGLGSSIGDAYKEQKSSYNQTNEHFPAPCQKDWESIMVEPKMIFNW